MTQALADTGEAAKGQFARQRNQALHITSCALFMVGVDRYGVFGWLRSPSRPPRKAVFLLFEAVLCECGLRFVHARPASRWSACVTLPNHAGMHREP
jgi:hypothetical protein